MSQRSKRRGSQFLGRGTLGSTLGLASAILFLAALMLASCGLTRLADETKAQVMAQYTPSSDTFAPRSDTPSSKMPLPWPYHLSRVRDLGTSPQAKLGDL